MGTDVARDAPHGRVEALDWPVTSTVGPALAGAVACGTRVAWYDPGGRVTLRGRAFDAVLGEGFESVAFHLLSGERAESDADGFERFESAITSADPRSIESDSSPNVLAALAAAIAPLRLPDLHDAEAAGAALGALTAALLAHASGGGVAAPNAASPPASIAGRLTAAISRDAAANVGAGALELALIGAADDDLAPEVFAALVVASSKGDTASILTAFLATAAGHRSLGALEAAVESLAAGRTPPADRRAVHAFTGLDPRSAPLMHRLGKLIGPLPAERRDRARRVLALAGAEAGATSRVHASRPGIGTAIAAALAIAGVPPALAPAVAAIGRSAGCMARVLEYLPQVRIFRPVERYVSPDVPGDRPRS